MSAWPPIWARGLSAPEAESDALYLALEAARWPVGLEDGERRGFAAVVLALLDARQQGASRLPLAALGERLARLDVDEATRAAARALAASRLAHPALGPFVGRPGDYKPFIVDGDCLYAERDRRVEEQLADALAARLQAPPATVRGAAPLAPAGRSWTADQAAAIEAARRRPFVAISGGPGSGKTALIDGIVRAFLADGIATAQIAIAAPTGKAANRIAELLPPGGPAPRTLHRLLGYAARAPGAPAGDFRHHENHPVPYAAVIVDEASMVGLGLMAQLMRALAPATRLVLIGDADQLPAVEVGNVLSDLRPYAVQLSGSHRMNPSDPAGAAVLQVATAIAAGDLGSHGAPAVRAAADIGDAGLTCLDPGEGATASSWRRLLAEFLDYWVARRLRAAADLDVAAISRRAFPIGDSRLRFDDAGPVAALLAHHRRARILTVTRAAADRINDALVRRLAQDARSPDLGLTPGTPVMMAGNDYDRELWNGDQGVVVRVAAGRGAANDGLAVVFARGAELTAHPLASLEGAIAIAYASTVHKAQGSELDHAALVLPEGDSPLLSRELVYTAVTRVRRSIVVVGQRALLARAVGRPLDRASGLGERLRARGATSPGNPASGS